VSDDKKSVGEIARDAWVKSRGGGAQCVTWEHTYQAPWEAAANAIIEVCANAVEPKHMGGEVAGYLRFLKKWEEL
jgi:hypothetical protein